MDESALLEQIHRAKVTCLPVRGDVEALLWTLATELERRLTPPPAPASAAPQWEAHRPIFPDWSAA